MFFFLFFFFASRLPTTAPSTLCVFKSVCTMGGDGGFRWSKCWEACAQQVCELEGSVIQFIYKPWKKFQISFHHMDTTAREFLTKGVMGVKNAKRKKIYRNAEEKLERAKRKHTNQKQTTQRHLSEPCSFYGFINMNKHCPVLYE